MHMIIIQALICLKTNSVFNTEFLFNSVTSDFFHKTATFIHSFTNLYIQPSIN